MHPWNIQQAELENNSYQTADKWEALTKNRFSFMPKISVLSLIFTKVISPIRSKTTKKDKTELEKFVF